MKTSPSIEEHVRGVAAEEGWVLTDEPIVVAVSGGLDSMVLLYTVRYVVGVPPDRIHVAHLDHRMREGSAADADWLRGVCTAWTVPFHLEATERPIESEGKGRAERYDFLNRLKETLGARSILTAHTADDQAETVLFRMARGAGPRGLAAVRERLSSGVVRPLLPFWRADLETLARTRRVPFRTDPSNADLRWARNRIRHCVLPELERAVPGARASLAGLTRLLVDERSALDSLTDDRIRALTVEAGGEDLLLDRAALLDMPEALLAQVIRRAGARLGVTLSPSATRAAVDFVRTRPSGRRIEVGGGVTLFRSFDRIGIGRHTSGGGGAAGSAGSGHVTLSGAAGQDVLEAPGVRIEVRWDARPVDGFPYVGAFLKREYEAPLELRTWRPGDRARMAYGKKNVAKLLGEFRVPSADRLKVPVLTDASGDVLWVPGLTEALPPGGLSDGRSEEDPAAPAERLWVGIRCLL